ncbi:MAG: lysophospholipid acyltransferase family protein [Cyclobacteriaceae bacterium]
MPFVYYIVIVPLSLVPSRILYLISDLLLYPVIYLLVGFRKKVVVNNIKMAFPDASEKRVKEIMKAFYHHFCDLIVESVMLFGMSEKEAIRRCKLTNPEVFEPYFKEGRSVALVGGHYNNWELLAVAIAPQMQHQVDAIYAPLTNAFMEKKMLESRSKYGLRMTPKKQTARFIAETVDEKTAMIFAVDQAPYKKSKAYWTQFFNKDTAVAFGAERYSVEYDWPVLFCRIAKVKRGMYEMTFDLVTDDPKNCQEGWITQRHTKMVEEQVSKQPEFWLWTHKRWKRKRKDTEVMNPSLL